MASDNGINAAFPCSHELYGGLTKREYMATQIAAAMIAFGEPHHSKSSNAELSRLAVETTDALLEELSK